MILYYNKRENGRSRFVNPNAENSVASYKETKVMDVVSLNKVVQYDQRSGSPELTISMNQ